MVFRLSLLAIVLTQTALTAGTPRSVWPSGATIWGSPSPDGRWISCVDGATGNLARRDNATGELLLLTQKPTGSKEFAYFSVISRDGEKVAFAWHNEQGFYDLRITSSSGPSSGTGTVLYSNEEAGFVQPSAWSPDGKSILTLFFRKDNISQIALVPVDGGEPKVLRSLQWVYPKKMDFSPDGRFIVYDNIVDEKTGARDIFVLASDGSAETKLIADPADDLFPIWSPRGNRIFFASNKGGSMGLWSVLVNQGKPAGDSKLVRSDLGRILPMGMTDKGSLYYGLREGSSELYVASVNGGRAQRIVTRTPGSNFGPAWSPDGKRLAFLTRRGSENFGHQARMICIRSVKTGDEIDLAPKLAHIERIRWTPDGSALLASGTDGKGRSGLFEVHPESGDVKLLVWNREGGLAGVDGAISGGKLLYINNGIHVRQLSNGDDTVISSEPSAQAVAAGGNHQFAVLEKDQIKVLSRSGEPKSVFQREGVERIEWSGNDLIFLDKEGFWRLRDGSGLPEKLPWKGTDFAVHPDGQSVVLAIGGVESSVWAIDGLLE